MKIKTLEIRTNINKITKEEILEGNKLIAEFLGLTIITDGISLFDANYKQLAKYNESWNDLMPVVEKIDSIIPDNCMVKIEYRDCVIPLGDDEAIYKYESTKIKAVWQAVVEFIKWYNTQNK